MAIAARLLRFRIDLSDLDRACYAQLDFRVAQHPSESVEFLLTRVLAYALNFQEGLEFSAGLSQPDEPAIKLTGEHGVLLLAIEIANPSAARLHKISKAAKAVKVYTYKNPENLRAEVAGESVHRASEIQVFSLEPKFLQKIAEVLDRDNAWILVHNEGELMLTVGDESLQSTLGVCGLE